MRVLILAVLFLVCLVLWYWLGRGKSIYFKVLLGGVIILLWVVVGRYISSVFVYKSVEDKVNKVIEACGDTYIRLNGDTVYVLIDEEWVDINSISVIGDIAEALTEDIYIEYDGHSVYVGHSGVVNTLRVLQDLGMIE